MAKLLTRSFVEMVFGSGKSVSSQISFFATDINAALGQAENQSSVQQSTRDGNFRQRTRKASPTGDMQSTM